MSDTTRPRPGQESLPRPPAAAPAADAAARARHAQASSRKPAGPRRVRSGIRLRSRDGVIASTPLSDTLVARLEELVPSAELAEGLHYARRGQVVSLEHEPGVIVAVVQGIAPRPREVRLRLGAFSVEQWESIIHAMAAEAVHLVRLLAGELPPGLDELLRRQGLALLPGTAADIVAECSCPAGGACKHVGAVGYIVAERLAQDPMLIFAMLGLPADRLLERLRQVRVLQARGVASAHADPMIPESQEEPPALEMCADEFWRQGPRLIEVQNAPPPNHATHALLRRLGPSPLKGKFPLVGLLASIYDSVAEHAARVRDRAEGEPSDRT